jgi:uridine phosphorylase
MRPAAPDPVTVAAQPIHLRPTAELAERVLLPGDPGRALLLAQQLIAKPRMFNHHRGLWGYTGSALADGKPLTIQSTGIGGPSAAVVFAELIGLGVRRAVRVGTCAALRADLALGELVIARESICRDGTSRALGAGERVAADGPLTEALIARARGARAGAIVSVDLFYDAGRGSETGGALARELPSAALFALGAKARVAVASVLAVSDTFAAQRSCIEDRQLRAAAEAMGAAAVGALAA